MNNINNNKVLETKDLSKIYTEGDVTVTAVDKATMQVYAGEMVAIMGPSGSGKTTLLSMMGCILRATSGNINLSGIEISKLKEADLPAIRRKYIGFIFQSFNLFSSLTVMENVLVALNLKRYKNNQARDMAMDLLKKVGLEKRKNFLPRDLSGGEKQRVSIARALAGSPPIILADEPTANLDSYTGQTIIELLRQLVISENHSVVVVTHDKRLTKVVDRVLYLSDGILTETEHLE